MSDFGESLVPITALRSPKQLDAKAPSRWTLSRFLMIGAFILALGGAGWGAKLYLGTSSKVEDEESFADLEGFESAPTFVAKTDDESSSTQNAAVPYPEMTAPDLGAPTLQSPLTTFLAKDSTTAADVWLTGTIEDPESSDKIELPQRLSGGLLDAPTLR